jgi:hypothetical protein
LESYHADFDVSDRTGGLLEFSKHGQDVWIDEIRVGRIEHKMGADLGRIEHFLEACSVQKTDLVSQLHVCDFFSEAFLLDDGHWPSHIAQEDECDTDNKPQGHTEDQVAQDNAHKRCQEGDELIHTIFPHARDELWVDQLQSGVKQDGSQSCEWYFIEPVRYRKDADGKQQTVKDSR